jgi:uncharacterized protein with HEPN domain
LKLLVRPAKKVDIDIKAKHQNIEWKKMAGMRDKLIHDYIGVDLWAVWDVIENILPNLEQDLNKLLQDEQV